MSASEDMLAAYARAVAARDVEALLRLYDADVRVFDAWEAWSYEGRAAWRDCIAAWFAGAHDPIAVSFDYVRTCGAEDGAALASVTAVVTYAAVAADGTRTRELQNRLTWVLRKGPDGWRIVHEHTSSPIDLGHGKPILRRSQPARESFAQSGSS